MAGKPCAPRKLARIDVREGFDSGAPELDQWLIRYSWQNQRSNKAVTYVSVLDGRVVGYYAIVRASMSPGSFTSRTLNSWNHRRIRCTCYSPSRTSCARSADSARSDCGRLDGGVPASANSTTISARRESA